MNIFWSKDGECELEKVAFESICKVWSHFGKKKNTMSYCSVKQIVINSMYSMILKRNTHVQIKKKIRLLAHRFLWIFISGLEKGNLPQGCKWERRGLHGNQADS